MTTIHTTTTVDTAAMGDTEATGETVETVGRRYLAPNGFGRRVVNPLASGLAMLGASTGSLHRLTVVGRHSGVAHSVPVSPVDLDGVRYLVAPRGETDWVLNLRSVGELTLRSGRRTQRYEASELREGTVAVLREYLTRYRGMVGQFFEPLDERSSDEAFAAVADGYPVFRLQPIS